MRTYENYTKGIGQNVLEWKNQQLSDYIECMQTVNTQFDEILLVMMARLYNFHMCVLMENKFWTTETITLGFVLSLWASQDP